MRIAIILGTRPEIIKMSPVIDEIQKRNMEFVLIHTGQHYDSEMSDNFFKDLNLPIPDYNIHAGSNSHGIQTASMMEGIENVLNKEKVDIVLVQGDTNAVLAGALVSSKLHIPVGHIEAGLRSFDNSMPEEINRKAADVASKIYFVPTEKSAINLSSEGISRKQIFLTGNTIVDACFRNLKIAKNRKEIFKNLDNIITLTLHRAENVDDENRLKNIIESLKQLKDTNIVFPIHPRTEDTLKRFNLLEKLEKIEHIHIIKPMGYLDFLLLLSKSSLILTDSGGLQEEAITLNIPVLTLRYNTERPETVESGANILVGADTEKIVKTANEILNNEEFARKMKNALNPYGDGDAAIKILDAIEHFYNNDLLAIKSPEDIMLSFKREIAIITEDITVSEFEKKNNTLVKTVYSNKMHFPTENLNIKGFIVVFDKFT